MIQRIVYIILQMQVKIFEITNAIFTVAYYKQLRSINIIGTLLLQYRNNYLKYMNHKY